MFGITEKICIFVEKDLNKQKNIKKMETQITRLDYKNQDSRGFYSSFPPLKDVKEITDINEIESVSFVFASQEEAEKFAANFPKTYRPRVTSATFKEKGEYISKPYASIKFNTFWTNETTGEINEAAFSKREKFIKKLKSITQSN